MCVINISLNPATPAGTTITNRNGRYRKVGTTTWTNFSITSNSYALNVNDLGQYELQVNITNSLGTTSVWASSTFSVTTTCGGTIGGGSTNCVEYSIFANQGVQFIVNYTNCNGTPDSVIIPSGDEAPVCSTTVPSIVSGNGSITLTGLDNCTTTTTTTPTPITPTGVFSNGRTKTESHSLPGTDPNTTEITGTLTVTGGSKRYNVSVKNQFNYSNSGQATLIISGIGTLTVSTDGTPNAVLSSGTLTVPVGTFTYTLKARLAISGGFTMGAVTSTIVDV